MANTFQEVDVLNHLNINYMKKGDLLIGSGTVSNSTTSDSNILPIGASGSILVASSSATYGVKWSNKVLQTNWISTYATTMFTYTISTLSGIPLILLDNLQVNTGTNTTSDYFYIYNFASQRTSAGASFVANDYAVSGIFVNNVETVLGRSKHSCGSQYEWGMQGNSGYLKNVPSNATVAIWIGQGGSSSTELFSVLYRSLVLQRLNAQ